MKRLNLWLLIIAAFSQIGIYETVEMNFMAAESEKENCRFPKIQTENTPKFFKWFLQFFGQIPIIGTSPTTSATPKPGICPKCKCGLANTQRRIVNGVETRINQYPWVAQLLIEGRFFCGASVISDRYVLTAAHCVARHDSKQLSIRINAYNRSTTTETKVSDYPVAKIMFHKFFSYTNYDNDIALVELQRVIPFTGLMRPVCLPEAENTFSDEIGIVTGWGATQQGGSASRKLLEVSVPIISNFDCRTLGYDSDAITANMICAGYVQGGKDSCQGDSGGPMHVRNATNKVHRIVGIVSWGEGCGRPNYPGVYTRVNRYLTWMRERTSDSCYCTRPV